MNVTIHLEAPPKYSTILQRLDLVSHLLGD